MAISIIVHILQADGVKDGEKTHPISELEVKMDQAILEKSRKMTQEKSLNIRLTVLREKYSIKKSGVANFTQTAISKLEDNKDIRISTLIEYLDSLGMGLEITAYHRNSNERELLLRI